MSNGTKLTSGVLAGVAMTLCILAALAVPQEIGQFAGPETAPVAGAAMLRADNVREGISPRAQQRSMGFCYNLVRSLYVLTLPSPDRDAIVADCRQLASAVVAKAPSNGLGWLVLAASNARLGDADAANADLARSYVTARNERWIVEMRVAVAETMNKDLASYNIDQHLADIQLLALSPFGVHVLARLSLASAVLEQRVVGAIGKLPQDVQQRYLNAVWRAGNGG